MTITGTGSTGTPAVDVGAGTDAFTVSGDTSTTATVPAGSGTVDITVLRPNGPSEAVTAGRSTHTG